MFVVYLLICIVLADFLTGFFHWIEDTYGVPSWPFIGKTIIKQNINHHRHPSMANFMGSLFARIGAPLPMALIVVTVMLFTNTFSWWAIIVILLTIFGDEVHNANHDLWKHRSVDFLRNYGVIQNKKHHAKHHIPPYDKAFCTLTNYLNPVLDSIKFWRALESCLSSVGIKPKRCSAAREGY